MVEALLDARAELEDPLPMIVLINEAFGGERQAVTRAEVAELMATTIRLSGAARDRWHRTRSPRWKWRLGTILAVGYRLREAPGEVSLLSLTAAIRVILDSYDWALAANGVDDWAALRVGWLDVFARAVAGRAPQGWSRGIIGLDAGASTPIPLAERIRRRRQSAGLSQGGLAKVLGVDRSTVVRWETDERHPAASHRAVLARVLGGRPGDYAAGLASVVVVIGARWHEVYAFVAWAIPGPGLL